MFAKKKAKSPRTRNILSFVGLSVVASVLVAAAVTPAIAVSGLTANSTLGVFNDLPAFLEIGQLAQRSSIYAKNSQGKDVLLASFYAQNRKEVGWDDINQFVKDASTSGEDPRFYEHGAIDLMGTARAFLSNLIGNDVQGGSSITQQYVKNVLVQKAESISDPVEREKAYNAAVATNIDRKIKEMKLAIGVEQKYSKQEILNGYLNITSFGGRIYGIEAAAEYYFSKTAKTLTIEEAAALIATVNSPNMFRIDQPENLERNKLRRDYIIARMAEYGKITNEQRDKAIATPITPKLTNSPSGCQAAPYGAAYFCDYITWIIKNDTAFGATEDDRWTAFQRGGWKIYSTMNVDLQHVTDANMIARVPAHTPQGQIAGASTSVEVGTGRILAMAQSKKYSNDPDVVAKSDEFTSVNYSTDKDYGGSSGFQVGSTYKIFTVAEWLKQGHGLGEMVDGREKPLDLSKFKNSCDPVGGGIWNTKNNGGDKGSILSVASAITTSLNHAFFNMALQLDLCNIRKQAEAFGVHRADGNKLGSNPAALIGTNEIAPLTMVAAVAGVANNGLYCSPVAIDAVLDMNGNKIEPPKSSCKQALAQDIDMGLVRGLKGPIEGGTAGQSNPNDGIAHIGKTGSTDNFVHTWMLGASHKVATVVWVGNVSGFVSLSNTSLNGESASSIRHMIWRPIMAEADRIFGGSDWTAPDSKFLSGRSATIPDVRGLSLTDAQKLIESVHLTFVNGGVVDSNVATGQVVQMSPAQGGSVPTSTIITVFTSNGTGIAMPNFVGLTQQQAEALAIQSPNNWHITWKVGTTPQTCSTPALGAQPTCAPLAGTVTAQNKPVGSFLSPGKTITLTRQGP
jgi:membrane peptidoglycan carboxypeptidase